MSLQNVRPHGCGPFPACVAALLESIFVCSRGGAGFCGFGAVSESCGNRNSFKITPTEDHTLRKAAKTADEQGASFSRLSLFSPPSLSIDHIPISLHPTPVPLPLCTAPSLLLRDHTRNGRSSPRPRRPAGRVRLPERLLVPGCHCPETGRGRPHRAGRPSWLLFLPRGESRHAAPLFFTSPHPTHFFYPIF
jgi:hypothetical protein